MKIKRLVIGSSNPGKVNEWTFLLKNNIKVVSVLEIGIKESPKETGKTFLENAIKKARYYAKKTGEFILSEDGGFEVDFLNGLPGVKSRRILPGGKDGTDEQLINYILKKLEGVPRNKRIARITSAVVVSDPKGKIIYEDKGGMEGIISRNVSIKLIEGYPYRSILYLPKIKKYYSELTEKEHKKLAHKKIIAERLVKFLLKYR
jgi:XTP/dITP diphosphohydrolase